MGSVVKRNEWSANGLVGVAGLAAYTAAKHGIIGLTIESVLGQVLETGGALEEIAGENSPFTLRFAQGQTTAEITLDSTGQIIGLLIQPLVPRIDTLNAAIEQFEALPGAVSVLVQKDGKELAALNPDDALAIGSAFKLAILNALRDQLEAGEHQWDEGVTLDPHLKSLPGGMIQKLSNADLLEQYLAGDEADKRAVLDELAGLPLPTPAEMPGDPALDVEWFFTPGQLCDLMAGLPDAEASGAALEAGEPVPLPYSFHDLAQDAVGERRAT